MASEILRLEPASIEASGGWLFWSLGDDDRLKKSLEMVGQLEPVLVRHEKGSYRLVAGSRRFRVLKRLGRKVLARVLEDDGTEPGLLYLASNTHRLPSDAELVGCVRYFNGLYAPDEMGKRICPLLGLDQQGKIWRQLLAWLDLSEEWDSHLSAGRIGHEAGLLLTRFSGRDRQALLPFFAELRWSRGATRQFLTQLFEAGQKEGAPADELLQRSGADAVLQTNLSPRDAIERLLRGVRVLRYPVLHSLEDTFAREVDSLGVAKAWRIEPEQQFETGRLVLTARVGSQKDLDAAVKLLARTAQAPEWNKLFGLGGEESD